MTDILKELEQRLREIGFNDPRIERVVMEVRREYAGERVYIGCRAEYEHARGERNRAIIRAYKGGERVDVIARRYRISRSMVWKVIKG